MSPQSPPSDPDSFQDPLSTQRSSPTPQPSASNTTGSEIQKSDAAEVEAFERNVSSLHHRQQQQERRSGLLRYLWALPVVALVGAVALRALTTPKEAATANAGEAASQVSPLSVRTETAQVSTLREFISGGGLVQATRFRNLSFDVEGKVTFIASGPDGGTLRAGDRVREGQLLATIDDRNLQANLQRARAAVVEAVEQVAAQQAQVAAQKAQVAQQQSQVLEAEAQVARSRSALKLAETELTRRESLFRDGVISEGELDTRRNTVADARANLTAAEARVIAAEGQVTAAQAQVTAAEEQLSASKARVATAEAGLTQAKISLEDTNLYAPFDGVVSFINLRLGERYSPPLDGTAQLDQNDATIAGTVPIVLVDPSELEASVALPTGGGARLEIGQSAFLIEGQNITAASLDTTGFADLSNLSLVDLAEASGPVVAVTPSVNPSLRTQEVTVEIKQGAEKLQHGDRVTAFVAVSTVDGAVTVPPDAVILRNRRPFVFVVNGDQVEQRPVQLGIAGLNEQQILSGVNAGEEVVTEGQTRLVDGTPIRVVGSSLSAP